MESYLFSYFEKYIIGYNIRKYRGNNKAISIIICKIDTE